MTCVTVADLSDIAIRIWEEDGTRIPAGTWRAAEYLESIGLEGPKRNLEKRMQTHRNHVERFMARPSQAIAPFQLLPAVKPNADPAVAPPSPSRFIPPERTGPAHWTNVQQNAMDVGNDALALIEQRLASGMMEDGDVIAVAKLGVASAGKRADIEAKGKRLNQVDELLRMAAGMSPQPRVIENAPKQVGSGDEAPS
jgi:hypothetical protein